VKRVVVPAMRHRCLMNFEAEAEGVSADEVLSNILETVPASAG
jgi:MoxR-like ATPase